MQSKFISKIVSKGTAALLALGVALASSNAMAVTNVQLIQAGFGHPFNFGSVNHASIYSDPHYGVFDGRIISVSLGSFNWITPVTVLKDNAALRGQQLGSTASSRLCSFDVNGAFFSCSPTVNDTSVFSVFVPSNGTAFFQSFISADTGSQVLSHFRAFND